MMNLYTNLKPEHYAHRFVIFNIDERTYQQWNRPLIIPRDKLLKLLEFAIKGQPRLIIVDIELSYPDTAENDQRLRDFFYNYCTEKSRPSDCPHIILARSFHKRFINYENETVSYLVQNPSILDLDSIVAKSPYLHWASTLYDPDTKYNIVRHWRLWEASCTMTSPSQPVEIIPAMQLLSTVLLKDPLNGAEKLAQKLKKLQSTDCIKKGSFKDKTLSLELDRLTINLIPKDLNRRVIYTIPWDIKEEQRPYIEGFPLIKDLYAHEITDSDQELSTAWHKQAVVMIGGSFKDNYDFHATPIGQMPGYFVNINAIHSLLQFGELSKMSPWVKYAIELVLILCASFLFAKFNSLKAMLLLLITSIIFVVPLAVWGFKYGVWLNFIIVIFAVFIHQLYAYIEELQELSQHQHNND